jgi:polyhydroxybutyrate depolymerase
MTGMVQKLALLGWLGACWLVGCGGDGSTAAEGSGSPGDTGTGDEGSTETTGSGTTVTTRSQSVLGPLCTGKPSHEGDSTFEVMSGGMTRSAVVHAPPGYDGKKPLPLVLAFHFANGSPALMAQATHLNEAADHAGALVVYPEGIGGAFNAGKCCGKAWEDKVNDLGFTRDLLDALAEEYCVDAGRVFVTGMANGAMMAYRLGCELAERFAGLSPVAGALHTVNPCLPYRALPVLHIHGTADTAVPYDGGEGQPAEPVAGDMMFPSVGESTAPWRAVNGCSDETELAYQKGDASCVVWKSCGSDDDSVVEVCTIDGGGATWPGGTMPAALGKTSQDLDASARIMEFFMAARPQSH